MIEKTLVLIKPDGIKRNLIGKIISFYEEKDLKITAMKMIKADVKTVEQHYEEHKNKPFFRELIEFLTEDKLVAIIIEGENSIQLVRKINGATDPLQADSGSIRGKFANNKERNLVHSSDSLESAKRELKIWFPELS